MCQRLLVCAVILAAGVFSSSPAETLVSGFLRYSDGTPISNGEVSVGQGWISSASTNSAYDGSFKFSLEAGNWWLKANWESWKYAFTVGSGPVQLSITNPPITSQIEGFIRTEAGLALTNIQIDFHATNGGFQFWTTARSDSNGFFSANLPNGLWSVQPNMYGFVFQPIPPQQIEVQNSTNSSVMIVAYEPTNIITGRISDERGGPITNLTVKVSYQSLQRFALTDSNGIYTTTMPSGWYYVEPLDLAARKLVGQSSPFPPIEATNAVTIHNVTVFQAPYEIRIRFQDENGVPFQFNNPPGYYYVSARAFLIGDVFKTLTNNEAVLNVSPGVWDLSVDAPSAYQRPRKTVQVFDQSIEVTFKMVKWKTNSVVSGQILDESSQPVTNTTVRIDGWPMDDPPPEALDANGRFLFNVPAAHWSIYLSDTNRLFPSDSVDVSPGETVDKIFYAPRLSSQIHILITNAEALSYGINLNASSLYRGQTYYQWKYSTNLQELALPAFPGQWEISASSWSGMSVSDRQIVTVPELGDVTVVFNLQPYTNNAAPQVRLLGQIVGEDGAPLAQTYVRAIFGTDWRETVTEGDGRFEFSGPKGAVDFAASRWTPIRASAYFAVQGDVFDLGQIVLPAPTIKGRFRFLDENDTEIAIPPNYSLNITRENGFLEYGTQAYELNQQLPACLSPGEWNVTAPPIKGYSFGRPLTFNATPNFLETIRFRKLSPVSAAPTFTILRGADGQLNLRATSESASYVTIEKSSDLKSWSYASGRGLSDPYFDVKLSELASSTNGPVFFRVKADK